MDAINALKVKFGENRWFANEKDDSFKSSIGQIYQTFCDEDLYPSVEEKAAMLLYLVVKNYSFSYGNKRILTFCLKHTGIFTFLPQICHFNGLYENTNFWGCQIVYRPHLFSFPILPCFLKLLTL